MVGDILKGIASLLWPAIAGFALWYCRAEISALLGRLRKLGNTGAEFDPPSVLVQLTAMPIEQALREAVPVEKPHGFIVERVGLMRKELEQISSLDTDAKRLSLLMLRLVESQQIVEWQFVWLNIFGSQLESVEAMLGSGTVDLQPFFESHQHRYATFSSGRENPPPPLAFEAWCAFISRNDLATISESCGELTQRGREFLAFASRANLPRFQAF